MNGYLHGLSKLKLAQLVFILREILIPFQSSSWWQGEQSLENCFSQGLGLLLSKFSAELLRYIGIW